MQNVIYSFINDVINNAIVLLPLAIIYEKYPSSQPYIKISILLYVIIYSLYSLYLFYKAYNYANENFDTNYHPYLSMPGYGGITEITPSYGYIKDNIAFGNGLSWSDRTNPYIDTNLSGPQDAITYQGTPMPLSYEDNPTTPVPMKDSMYKFSNYACKPECCLYSPFSCSNGCVCWEAPQEKFMGTENDAITPTS